MNNPLNHKIFITYEHIKNIILISKDIKKEYFNIIKELNKKRLDIEQPSIKVDIFYSYKKSL